MKEMTDWNGHHVLAVPAHLKLCPAHKARLEAVWALVDDLGLQAESRLCGLCPMLDASAETILRQCTHPRGLDWALMRGADKGGCAQRVIVAEEYIPLVQMRLGEQT